MGDFEGKVSRTTGKKEMRAKISAWTKKIRFKLHVAFEGNRARWFPGLNQSGDKDVLSGKRKIKRGGGAEIPRQVSWIVGKQEALCRLVGVNLRFPLQRFFVTVQTKEPGTHHCQQDKNRHERASAQRRSPRLS